MSNKNWWILVVFWLFYWVGQLTRSNAMTYYANWVLGSTYADGITQTLLNVIGGFPMGIGIFLVWPLSKKFGKKTVTAIGFILCTIGDIICFLNPSNLIVVLIGQFILNMALCLQHMFFLHLWQVYLMRLNINAVIAVTVLQQVLSIL